jgi:hypothetical protein
MLYQDIGDDTSVSSHSFFWLARYKSSFNNRVINYVCYQFYIMRVLADDIAAESGILFLSVKSPFCAHFASIGGGLLPAVIAPLLRATLLIYYQVIAITSI